MTKYQDYFCNRCGHTKANIMVDRYVDNLGCPKCDDAELLDNGLAVKKQADKAAEGGQGGG